MLEHVKDFDQSIPTANLGFQGTKWGWLLAFDYLFGFSLKKDENGDIYKKLDNPGLIGKAFNSNLKNVINKLKETNREFQEPFPIPSINAENFDREFFSYWDKNIKTPLIIKGFLKDAAILKEADQDHLIKHKGDLTVRSVYVDKKDKSRTGQNMTTVESSLEEFLTEEEYENNYINNFHGILEDEDFKVKCRGDKLDEILQQNNFLAQWFISRSSSMGSSLHCAGAVNMFLNIKGQKQWDFIHPSYSAVLQTTVSKYGTFAVSEMFENFSADAHKELLAGYQFMKHIPFYRCVMEEGDILYNPEYWWHSVRNLTDYTVGCATRYGASSFSFSPIVACMILDMIKHPKKSSTVQVMKIMSGKQSKSNFNDIVFTNNTKKK